MGPSRLFHKDRSQHSLVNAQDANEKKVYHQQPLESPLHSPGLAPLSTAPRPYDDDDDDAEEEHDPGYGIPYRPEDVQYAHQQQSGHPYPPEDAQYYRQVNQPHQPTRSQSQRSPTLINTNHPTIHLVRPSQGAASTPASAVEPDEPDRYYIQRPEPNPPPPKEDRKQKRRFFGLGSSKESSTPSNKLGRSRSIRGKEQYPEQVSEAQRQTHHQPHQSQQSHHHWGSTHVSPTDDDEEEEDSGGAGLHLTNQQAGNVPPGPPDKDPLRSPGFPPPISQQEFTYGKAGQQPSNQNAGVRYPLDRQTSHQSPWERTAYQVQQHTHSDPVQQQANPSYHPSPASATSTSGHPFQHRSPHDALHQHYQDQDSRPPSRQSLEPPPSVTSHPYGHHTRASSSQASSISQIPSSMGPLQGQPQPPSRRSSEAQQSQQGAQSRELVYQPYTQGTSQQYASQLAPQGQSSRGAQPSPMQGEQGRSTPPPSRSRDDLSNLDVPSLLGRHDELQDKYRKVKKYYFDKDAQVQQLQGQVLQLQDTLAHQRLSLSRTSLDDNEYANRFGRLDGAINNLAFNLRRDWRAVPSWLAPYVNRDATTQQTREMTAVGRATISRWLVEEILDNFFHPALEPRLSLSLKFIERNLRRYSPPSSSDEEKDALVSKIATWRLSTIEGLQDILNCPEANENYKILTHELTESLSIYLADFLKEPAPPGLQGGVGMIIELTIGIAANLPLESRDVFVEYINPGRLVDETYMKVEAGLPSLTNPGDDYTFGDTSSTQRSKSSGGARGDDTGSIDSRDTGTSNSDDTPASSQPSQQTQTSPSTVQSAQQPSNPKQDHLQQMQQQSQQVPKKKGMFGSLMSGGSSSSTNTPNKKAAGPQLQQQQQGQQSGGAQQQGGNVGGIGGGAASGGQHAGSADSGLNLGSEKKEDRVRFSTFMSVEVRGKNVLIKAPVYVRE